MRSVVAAAVVLTACGSGSVSVTEYATSQRDAHCRHLVVCGEVDSFETCQTTNLGVRFGLTASQQAAIDMGAVVFDRESAAACLDALGARGCDPTAEANRRTPDACSEILHGTRHADAACGIDDECISRSCDVPDCDTACCTGICIGDEPPVRGKLDEPCTAGGCEDGLFCDRGTGMCAALRPLGGFCASLDECRFGLYCNAIGECDAALPALGQPCTTGCRDEGTQCSPASRTCLKVALVGAACQTSDDCSPLYRCDQTLHCSAGQPLGAACTGSDRCIDDGAFCDIPLTEAMGTCALPKADGERCLTDPQCGSQRCDPATHLCAAVAICL